MAEMTVPPEDVQSSIRSMEFPITTSESQREIDESQVTIETEMDTETGNILTYVGAPVSLELRTEFVSRLNEALPSEYSAEARRPGRFAVVQQ